MRKAFSAQSFWVLKSPEKIFFGCIQLALAWCPPLLKKAVLGRKEKGREERKEAEEKGKKRRDDVPLFCLSSPGREAEVCNSIRGKVAKGGIIPTKREREYDEPAKLATSTRCPQRLFR